MKKIVNLLLIEWKIVFELIKSPFFGDMLIYCSLSLSLSLSLLLKSFYRLCSFYYLIKFRFFISFYFFIGLLTGNSRNVGPQIFGGPPTGEWRDGVFLMNITTVLFRFPFITDLIYLNFFFSFFVYFFSFLFIFFN